MSAVPYGANVIDCDECQQPECGWCYDFNGTEDEVAAHGETCPDRPNTEGPP